MTRDMMSLTNAAFVESHDSHVDTILTLPSQTSALAVAQSCRDTALVFMEDSLGWGKGQLAMWLMGPYGQITQYTHAVERVTQSGRYPRVQAPLLREIDARMVDRVISSARDEVIARLGQMIDGDGEPAFVYDMVSLGFVVRCEDARQIEGWVPSSTARRLADRVLSLFAADYLVRPQDYESELAVCRKCGIVEFDAVPRARGVCSRHGSGVFVPGGGSFFPQGA
jgi:hypothetical protein